MEAIARLPPDNRPKRRAGTPVGGGLANGVLACQHGIACEFHETRRHAVIQLDQIHSLSEFQRSTKSFVRRLKKTRQPAVLTVNGRAEVVVQDAGSYQELLLRLDRLEAIEGIREGLASFERGESRSLEDALEEVRRRLNLPPGAWSTKSK